MSVPPLRPPLKDNNIKALRASLRVSLQSEGVILNKIDNTKTTLFIEKYASTRKENYYKQEKKEISKTVAVKSIREKFLNFVFLFFGKKVKAKSIDADKLNFNNSEIIKEFINNCNDWIKKSNPQSNVYSETNKLLINVDLIGNHFFNDLSVEQQVEFKQLKNIDLPLLINNWNKINLLDNCDDTKNEIINCILTMNSQFNEMIDKLKHKTQKDVQVLKKSYANK